MNLWMAFKSEDVRVHVLHSTVLAYHAMDRSSHFTPTSYTWVYESFSPACWTSRYGTGIVLPYVYCLYFVLRNHSRKNDEPNDFKMDPIAAIPLTHALARLQQSLSRQILRSRIGFP